MRASVLAGGAVLCAASAALAYRPFDGTDAAVAEPGNLEVELGPAGFLALGPDRFLVAPALIANLGFAEGWELVLEGRQELLLDAPSDAARLRIVDTQLNLKTVLRSGELQDQPGPSVALEAGVLLPTVNDEPGTGAQATVIASRRWTDLTAHLNLGIALTRDGHLELPGSLILEGPARWTVRPVFELFSTFKAPDELEISGLGGLIWRTSERLALDAGLRLGSSSGKRLVEARLGLTVAFEIFAGKPQTDSRSAFAHLLPQ